MRGGKQPGAGRPKGAVTRPQLRDYFTDKEIKDLVKHVKQRAMIDDGMARYVMDHIYGKAMQPVGGDVDNPIVLQITGMRLIKDE